MSESDKTILIVDDDQAMAANLKELIEFMDTPHVVTSAPKEWRKRIGKCRLEAMFVGAALTDDDLGMLLADLKKYDPNVPVVVLERGA